MKNYTKYILIGLAISGLFLSSVNGATYLFPSGGGLGTSTAPTFGQVPVGNALGTYTLTATSSLGFPSASGISSLNGLTGSTQTFASSSSATDFSIQSSGTIHTFYVPTASALNRGLLSPTDWSTFNGKQNTLSVSYPLVLTGSTLSTAFGTTTNNVYSGTNTYNSGIITDTITALTSSGIDIKNSSNNTVGNFGAGPGTALSINGSLSVGLSSANYVQIAGAQNGSAITFTSLGTDANHSLSFLLGGNGAFGIGTSTASTTLSVQGNGLFSGNLSVAGLTATGTINFSGLSSGLLANNGGILYGGIATNTASCSGSVSCSSFTVLSSGAITISGTSLNTSKWATSSDTTLISPNGATKLGIATTSSVMPYVLTTGGGIFAGGNIRATGTLQIDGNATSTFSEGITLTSGNINLPTGGRYLVNNAPLSLYPSFSYATSSWTGTTTIPLGPAYVAETWIGLKCFTDTGTLNVSINDGTNRMDLINASTTVGTNLLSTNNTFTASEKRYADVGTPASSPKQISCTVSKTLDSN